MATKGKYVGSAGKEKRGTSPSKPLQSGNNPTRSPKPSKADSTDKNLSSPSQKPIPSYLKPTVCSLNIKKDDSNHNSTSAHRRRSFDKPPSPSRIQKALLSSADKEKQVRASSHTNLSPRPATAPKPVTDRTSKTHRVVKSQGSAVKSSSTKKPSGHPFTKKEASTASSTKAPPIADTSHKLRNESKREDQGSSTHVVQEKEVKNVDEVVAIPPDLPPIDVPGSIEPKTDEDEKLKPCETPTTPENQDASTAVRTEESAELKINEHEIKDESTVSHPQESSGDEPKVEAQDMEEKEHASESPVTKEMEEDAAEYLEGNKDAAENAMTKEGEVDAAENPITKVRDEDATENPITTEQEDGRTENLITQTGEENKTEDPITMEGGKDAKEDSIAKEGEEHATEDPITEEGEDDATENPVRKEGEEKATETNIAKEVEMVSTADSGDAQNTKRNEEQRVDEGSQKHADGQKRQRVDGEEQKDVVEEEKRGAKLVTPKTPKQPDSGKKDSQDYNKVIEETASKLREKKNKVRALAGAFETVISLQEPEP